MNLPKQFNILPVKDKKPLVKWEQYINRAQTPEEKIELMKLNPNGKVGVICGPVSGILVLDIDGPEGEKSLAKFHIPKTWRVKTPRGIHYYFRWTKELAAYVTTRAAILEGVDIRGSGGYVVWYGWSVSPLVCQLASPPQWLVDILSAKHQSSGSLELIPKQEGITNNDWLAQQFDGMKEGNRNDTFTRIAGSLRSRGYNPNEIFILLQGKAKEVAFQDLELRTICSSVGRYEPRIIPQGNASSIEDFLTDIQKVEWICEPIVAKGAFGFIGGLPGTYKTFIMMDLAIECARGGGMWLGKFPTKAAKVLFIDQERARIETQRRFKAVLGGKNLTATSLRDRLLVRCGTTTRLDLQVSFDAFRKEVAEIRPDLIIVDSFVTFNSVDENSRQAIQVVLERIKQIRNEFGCTFLFIDHEGKGAFQAKENNEAPSATRIAGSIAKVAAAELVLTVRRQDSESCMVYMTKSTLAQETSPFLVKVEGQEKIKVEAY